MGDREVMAERETLEFPPGKPLCAGVTELGAIVFCSLEWGEGKSYLETRVWLERSHPTLTSPEAENSELHLASGWEATTPLPARQSILGGETCAVGAACAGGECSAGVLWPEASPRAG